MSMPRHRLLPLLALAGLAFLLSACAGPTKVVTEVSRFNRLAEVTPKPKTFALRPVDEIMADTLEYQTYADLTALALQERGWQRIEDATATPDAVVRLSYGVDSGRQEIRSTPGTQYFGGYRHFATPSGVFVAPSIAVIPPQTYSVTRYTRELQVTILDGPDLAFGNITPVFEARAVSVGATPSLAFAMPHMIRAVFTGFPGNNGETYVIESIVEEAASAGAPSPEPPAKTVPKS